MEVLLDETFGGGNALGWQVTSTPAGGSVTVDAAAPLYTGQYSAKLTTRSTTPATGDVTYLTKGLPTMLAGRLRYEVWFAEHPTAGRGFVWIVAEQVRDDWAWFDPGVRYDFIGNGGELSISRTESGGYRYDYPTRVWEVLRSFNPGSNPAGSNNWHYIALDVDWEAGALVGVWFDSVNVPLSATQLDQGISSAMYSLVHVGVAARTNAQAGLTIGRIRVSRLPRGPQ